jgi:hypothetical protein
MFSLLMSPTAVVAAATSSAERLDKLIGMVMGGNEDRWWLIKEKIDY